MNKFYFSFLGLVVYMYSPFSFSDSCQGIESGSGKDKIYSCLQELSKRITTIESTYAKQSDLHSPQDLTLYAKKNDLPDSNVVSVTHITENGPQDFKDNGLVSNRDLSFNKKIEDSTIRIGYTDNFRVVGTNRACQWEILIDGKACPDGKRLIYDRHDGSSSNNHGSSHLVAYCKSLTVGRHILQVKVSPHPEIADYADSDCHTGWKESTWTLEAIEIDQR